MCVCVCVCVCVCMCVGGLGRRRQAIEMQNRMQQLMLKAAVVAFKQCTSSGTGKELSRREKTCVQKTVLSYFEAKCVPAG